MTHPKLEQIITKLRQIEAFIAQGQPLAAACKEAAISEQSNCRWKNEYGGQKLDHVKKRKDLERENARLNKPPTDRWKGYALFLKRRNASLPASQR
jgi:hypothetical protein